MNIAIFGGSFNPVHNEHVNIIKSAICEFNIDKVIIIPSHITPGKAGRINAPDNDRLNMCKIAFSDINEAEVSDYELKRGDVSYSYITCREFAQRYSDDKLYFIMGADMFENFPKWKNPEEILKYVTLAVCSREKKLETNSDISHVEFSYIGAKVSSTRIRTLASLGEDISAYVDKKTAEYIEEHNLYFINNIKKVKNYLTSSRWAHTVRVAIMAAENCSRFGIDERTAITAAALHDCAKYLPLNSPKLNSFTCPENVPDPVMHQYTGAYVAEHVFGITDENILNAIRYHTSGRENMSDLEKLIFLSDLLEEGRNFPQIEKLRESFSHSLNEGMKSALGHQLEYLKSTGEPIYTLTQKAYDYIKEIE